MARRIQALFLAAIVAIAVWGCSTKPNNEKSEAQAERVLQIPEHHWEKFWGVPFESKAIADTSEQEQEWSKAVGWVRDPFGSGTGFFVSPDGLFLTNHHVISKKQCGPEPCQGIQIIRNFTPNGDMEIFRKVWMVASNADLDYSLLKVEVKSPVPYLQLDEETRFSDLQSEQTDPKLFLIGHPFGTSVRSFPLQFESDSGFRMILRSSALSGASGSPVIHRESGKVMGLYNAISTQTQGVSINGEVNHVGIAIAIPDIVANIKKLYPDIERIENFGPPQKQRQLLLEETKDIQPVQLKLEDFEHLPEDSRLYALSGRWLNSISTQSVLAWLKKAQASSTAEYNYPRLIGGLLLVQLAQNEKLSFDAEQVQQITKTPLEFDPTLNMDLEAFQVFHGAISKKTCLDRLEQRYVPHDPIAHLLFAGPVCFSRKSIQPEVSILRMLRNILNENSPAAEAYEVVAAILETQLTYTDAAWQDREDALYLLEQVVQHSEHQATVFGAEGNFTLIQRNPLLVGPGSLRN